MHNTNPSKATDVLSQVLTSMRISGSLMISEEYISPWAVSVPQSNVLNKLLNTPTKVRVAAFHLVERGQIHIKLENGDTISLEAGEMAVCISGLGHTLYQGSSQQVISFQDIMAGSNHIFRPENSNKDMSTSLICGVFLLHDTLLNPLLSTLPKLLKVKVTNSQDFPRLYGVVKLLAQEFNSQNVGSSYVIERYLEILCVEMIRAHVDNLPEQATGWLCALKDPIVGRAIEAIHLKPGYNWTIKKLASEVTISPSRFSARFTATLGEPPMVYVTKWRMYLATHQLESNQECIEQIANNVGYESLAAFSRAFKRHVGLPPATWRLQSCSENN